MDACFRGRPATEPKYVRPRFFRIEMTSFVLNVLFFGAAAIYCFLAGFDKLSIRMHKPDPDGVRLKRVRLVYVILGTTCVLNLVFQITQYTLNW